MIYKFNYFYRIINNVNGHYYYGVHSTNDINDGYMGSGKRLHYAFKKYGMENFTKEILKYFDKPEDAYEYECEVVTEFLVKDDNCYNVKIGGIGGSTGMITVKDKIGNFYYVTLDDPRYLNGELTHVWKGKKHSDATKQRMREAKRKLTTKDPKTWVEKEGIVKCIRVKYLDKYLSDGWTYGRSGKSAASLKEKTLKTKKYRSKKQKIEKKYCYTEKHVVNKNGKITYSPTKMTQNDIKRRIEMIHNSGVDFTKWGWVTKIAALLGTNNTRVKMFMEEYDSDFYSTCYNKEKAMRKNMGIMV